MGRVEVLGVRCGSAGRTHMHACCRRGDGGRAGAGGAGHAHRRCQHPGGTRTGGGGAAAPHSHACLLLAPTADGNRRQRALLLQWMPHSANWVRSLPCACRCVVRVQILQQEGRKRAKLLQRLKPGSQLPASAEAPAAQLPEAGIVASVGLADQNLAQKLSRAGAHVLAPCPHDGGCPLSGGRAWCHFSQRFQRPGWMARLSAGGGSGSGGGDTQEERFAYVVIRCAGLLNAPTCEFFAQCQCVSGISN